MNINCLRIICTKNNKNKSKIQNKKIFCSSYFEQLLMFFLLKNHTKFNL